MSREAESAGVVGGREGREMGEEERRENQHKHSSHRLWNEWISNRITNESKSFCGAYSLKANKLSHVPSGVLQSGGYEVKSPPQAWWQKFSSPWMVFVTWLTWKQKRQMEQITKSSLDALAEGSTDVMSYIPRVKKRKKPSKWLQMFTVSLDKINKLQSKQTSVQIHIAHSVSILRLGIWGSYLASALSMPF